MNILLLRLSSHFHIQNIINSYSKVILFDQENNSENYINLKNRYKILSNSFLLNTLKIIYYYYSIFKIEKIIIPYNNSDGTGYIKWKLISFFCFSSEIESIDKTGKTCVVKRSIILKTFLTGVIKNSLNLILNLLFTIYIHIKKKKTIFSKNKKISIFLKKGYIKGGSQKIVYDLIDNNPDIKFFLFILQDKKKKTIFDKFDNVKIIKFDEDYKVINPDLFGITIIDWISILKNYRILLKNTSDNYLKESDCILNMIDKTFFYSLLLSLFFSKRLVYYVVEDITGKKYPLLFYLKKIDKIISDSKYMINRIKNRFNLKADLVHFGLKDITPETDVKELKKKFNLNNDIIIGTMGRIDRFKGQFNIIRIADSILNKGYNIKVLIIGNIEYEEHDVRCYFDEIKNFIDRSKYKENYIFKNHVENVADYINIFDIYLHLPAGVDPNPVMIYYAMACGKAIITFDNESSREQLNNGDCGILIKYKNLNEIEKYIENLIKFETMRKDIGKKAVDYFNKKFTFEIFNRKIRNYILIN